MLAQEEDLIYCPYLSALPWSCGTVERTLT